MISVYYYIIIILIFEFLLKLSVNKMGKVKRFKYLESICSKKIWWFQRRYETQDEV